MRACALSGWGQAHDALREVAPFATPVDYAAHAPLDPGVLAICDAAQNADTILGWSMGGRMALQAIARGWLKPRRLVLIGTPYQFVQHAHSCIGMGQRTYAQFRDNYTASPERTLKKAHALVAKDDTNAHTVLAHLQASRERLKPHNWLAWLEALAESTCAGMDFSGFPHTLLIHGDKDAVVDYHQSALFFRAMPHATQHIIPGAGHAPHWHNTALVRTLIEEFCHV